MRLVVTGRSGQVSTALQQACANRGDIECIAVGRPDLDLDKPQNVAAAIAATEPDVVVSAAAWTAVDDAEEERDAVYRANAESAGEVARGANLAKAPIIYLSSDYVFDGSKLGAWVEDDPTNPIGAYGASKLEGEKRTAQANPNYVILRTAWVYSPWGKNFVKTMLRLAESNHTLSVVDDQYGTPTSAFDISDAVLLVAKALRTEDFKFSSRVFHFAGNGSATWCDFATEIFRQTASQSLPTAKVLPVKTQDYPTRAQRPFNSRLNSRNFCKTFSWSAEPWFVGLQNVLQAIENNATSSIAHSHDPEC